MTQISKNIQNPDAVFENIWNTADIDIKTELNLMQIESINKGNTLSKMFASTLLKAHIHDLMRLMKSKDRKSMGEFVDSLKSRTQQISERKGGKDLHLLG